MMAAFVARRAFTALKFASPSRCAVSYHIQKRHFSFSKYLLSRLYTDKHEWILTEGNIGTVGISNHAQELLGEVVYVESPEVGAELQPGDVAGCLESVKAASDVYSPVGGVIKEVNEELAKTPGLVNDSPLEKGWLFKLEVDGNADTSQLMDEDAYKKFLEQAEH